MEHFGALWPSLLSENFVGTLCRVFVSPATHLSTDSEGQAPVYPIDKVSDKVPTKG